MHRGLRYRDSLHQNRLERRRCPVRCGHGPEAVPRSAGASTRGGRCLHRARVRRQCMEHGGCERGRRDITRTRETAPAHAASTRLGGGRVSRSMRRSVAEKGMCWGWAWWWRRWGPEVRHSAVAGSPGWRPPPAKQIDCRCSSARRRLSPMALHVDYHASGNNEIGRYVTQNYRLLHSALGVESLASPVGRASAHGLLGMCAGIRCCPQPAGCLTGC